MKLVLVLLYILSGDLKLEQIPVANETECRIKGGQRMKELADDPRFTDGLFAGCIAIKAAVASK